MEGPWSEHGNTRGVYEFCLDVQSWVYLRDIVPTGLEALRSGVWKSVLGCRSRFGNCQHVENPDAIVAKEMCVESS